MGLGFTVGLTCIGIVRELLGAGSIFGFEVIPSVANIAIFVMAPGAFFVLAGLTALQNRIFLSPSAKKEQKDKAPETPELTEDEMDNKAATMDDSVLATVEEKMEEGGDRL